MKLPDFIQIPSILLEDKSLQQLDWLVYGVIYWFSKLKLEKCYASNNVIADMLGAHPESISQSVNRLAKSGHVEVKIEKEKGNLREIIPLVTYKPAGGYPISPQADTYQPTGLPNNNNKEEYTNTSNIKEIDKEKILKRVKHTLSVVDLTYFTNLAPNVIWEFEQKFGLSEEVIRREAARAVDWIKSTGRSYTNYHFFFRNWLSRTAERKGNGHTPPQKRFALEDFDKYKGLDEKADRESKEWLARNRPDQFKEVCGMEAQQYLAGLTPA